jgi:hypothetical protein
MGEYIEMSSERRSFVKEGGDNCRTSEKEILPSARAGISALY